MRPGGRAQQQHSVLGSPQLLARTVLALLLAPFLAGLVLGGPRSYHPQQFGSRSHNQRRQGTPLRYAAAAKQDDKGVHYSQMADFAGFDGGASLDQEDPLHTTSQAQNPDPKSAGMPHDE